VAQVINVSVYESDFGLLSMDDLRRLRCLTLFRIVQAEWRRRYKLPCRCTYDDCGGHIRHPRCKRHPPPSSAERMLNAAIERAWMAGKFRK